MFSPATRKKTKLRMILIGPAGSGKTYTALKIAKGLGDKIAVFDTESGSASKYAGDVAVFDSFEPTTFEPERYIEAIEAAGDAKYDVLIIDSLTHAWVGKGGLLDAINKFDRKNGGSGDKFRGWADATPRQMALVDAMLRAKCHIIATIRSKMEYVQEKDSNGRTIIRKVGLQPVQRDGLEYEADVVGDIDTEHNLSITKSRCSAIAGEVIPNPGERLGKTLLDWLTDGVAPIERTAPPAPISPMTREVAAEHLRVLRVTIGIGVTTDLDEVLEGFGRWSRDSTQMPEAAMNLARAYLNARCRECKGETLSEEDNQSLAKVNNL